MNDLYQSSYEQPIYCPIYQGNIIFYDEEEEGEMSDVAEA